MNRILKLQQDAGIIWQRLPAWLVVVLSCVLTGLLYLRMTGTLGGGQFLGWLTILGGILAGWIVSHKTGGGFKGVILGFVPISAIYFGVFIMVGRHWGYPVGGRKYFFAVSMIAVLTLIGALIGAFTGLKPRSPNPASEDHPESSN